MPQEQELKIKKHLMGKTIKDIELYNINEDYYVFDPERTLVIDGGIEFIFEDSSFCYGWDFANGGYDYSLEHKLELLLDEAPHYALEAKQLESISRLIGDKIQDVDFKWDYYQDYDENGELKEEKIFVPIELILTTVLSKTIQIALIGFRINKDSLELVDPKYDLEGEILFNLGNTLNIEKLSIETQ